MKSKKPKTLEEAVIEMSQKEPCCISRIAYSSRLKEGIVYFPGKTEDGFYLVRDFRQFIEDAKDETKIKEHLKTAVKLDAEYLERGFEVYWGYETLNAILTPETLKKYEEYQQTCSQILKRDCADYANYEGGGDILGIRTSSNVGSLAPIETALGKIRGAGLFYRLYTEREGDYDSGWSTDLYETIQPTTRGVK